GGAARVELAARRRGDCAAWAPLGRPLCGTLWALSSRAPAVREGANRTQRHRAGGGRAQHLGAEDDRLAAELLEGRQLVRGDAALWPDDQHDFLYVGRALDEGAEAAAGILVKHPEARGGHGAR